MTSSKKHDKSSTQDITTQGSDLLAAFRQFASGVPLQDVSPDEAITDRAGNFIPDEAMELSAEIIESNPERFPDYDAASIRAALAFEKAMRPLGTQVSLLGEQITRNVQKHRSSAAVQSYALYQNLKGLTTGLSRLSKTDPIRAQQRALQKLVTTTRKSRATTVTQGELQDAAKGIKKTKVAAQKAALAAAATAVADEAAEAVGTATSVQAPASPVSSASPTVPTAPTAVPASH